MESGFLLQHVKQCSGLGVCGLGFRVWVLGFRDRVQATKNRSVEGAN